MEIWKEMQDFPGYWISDHGRVRNDSHDGRIKIASANQRGIVYVGLTQNGKRVNRSVSVLVADAFLEPPRFSTFDTPINLDGDRTNNCVSNLMWRPRWFAYKYMRQFNTIDKFVVMVPIVEIQSGERFENSWEAVVKYGVLHKDITFSIFNEERVFPTGQRFERA